MKATEVQTRIQLKNILFTTDFSAASRAAIPYALELGKHYGAKVHALHVKPPAAKPLTPASAWRSLEEVAAAEAVQHRQLLLDAFAGVEREVQLADGDLWSNITAVVEKSDIDLIVAGTRGRSGVAKLLLGSKAEEIYRNAPCPVLTVGPHSKSDRETAGEFSNILFATDFSPESIAAAPYAISLAQEYQAHLTVLHVVAEAKANELVRPWDLTASSEHMLRRLVPADAELWCEPKFVVERGEAAEKILDVAARFRADLIVLGMRKPSGFPGAATHLPIATAHKIVTHANCPVLTVRG
jgi:nucleotide-binding universal stress UspA family protein